MMEELVRTLRETARNLERVAWESEDQELLRDVLREAWQNLDGEFAETLHDLRGET